VLDEVHSLGTGPGGAVKRGAGAVLERRGSALEVTSDPLGHRGVGDTGLGDYIGDRTTGLDTHHQPVSGPEASTQRYGGSWQWGFLLPEG
jgi:hypothetical protein